MTGTVLLRVEGLRARHAGAEVLHGIDIELREGETVFVLGPNGAGKSTLLRCLAGRVRSEGRARFRGEEIHRLDTRERIQRGIVLCPEGRRLFPEMTVRENLILGAHLRRDRSEIEKDLRRLARHVPWLPDRLDQMAGSLSGGEQQLVAVARAFMARPRLLLIDEPTLGLSAAALTELRDWLRLWSREHGVSILGSEQNAVFARDVADRLALLEGGRIRSFVTPAELFSDADLADRLFGAVLPARGEES